MTTTIAQSAGVVHASDAVTDLHAAMYNAIAVFAEEAGLPVACANDIAIAGRQSVSMAAAYADLCRTLDIPLPAIIHRALS